MEQKEFTFTAQDETNIFVYIWLPDPEVKEKGVVQIAHGMAETAFRYERFAKILTDNGYLVYANDHRGHGRTAGDPEDVGYLSDHNGFELLVKDMYQLNKYIRKSHPELPLFLFGHSMGSFAAQRYIMQYGKSLKGAILSGSNGSQGILHNLGFLIAALEVKKYGRKVKSPRMDKLSFGNFNKTFQPNRTDFDWLSRDNQEIDHYIKDPYCGEVFTAGFFYDFLKGLRKTDKEKNMKLVPKNLPLLIFSGDKDPVGRFGKGVRKLYHAYKKHGVKDVTLKLYPEGRHEMLNEINREEVMEDVLRWLDLKVGE